MIITSNLKDFILQNKNIFIVTFIIGFLAHGIEITNITFGIDEEYFLQVSQFNGHELTGRWSLLVLGYVLPNLGHSFLSPIVTVFFITISAILISCKFENTSSKIIFGTLMISSPYFAYALAPNYQAPYVFICMFFAVLSAIIYYYSWFSKTISILVSIILLAFAIGAYQSLLSVFFTIIIFYLIIDYINGTVTFKQFMIKCIYAGLIIISGVVLYYIIGKLFVTNQTDYLNNFFKWGIEDFVGTINGLCTSAYRILAGIRGYPEWIFFASVSSIILGIQIVFKSRHKIFTMLQFSLMIIIFYMASLSSNIALGGIAPLRTQFAIPIFFAGGIALYWNYSKAFEKIIISIISVFLIISNAAYCSQLYRADYLITEADKMVAQRVLDKIYDVAPEFYDGKVPVAFIGYYRYRNVSPLLKGDETLGGSFFDWDKGNPDRMMLFLNFLGLPMDIPLARGLDYEKAKQYSQGMPVWPHKNSVELHDGVVIVNFGF